MAFDRQDYDRGAGELGAPVEHLMAVIQVEASGETQWTVDGKTVPPIRPEAHWFSAKTGHAFDAQYPEISQPQWNPSVAAKTRADAWKQFELMASLNETAAIEATSWGGPQIMGFHWRSLGYSSAQAFRDAMMQPSDDGQMDAFVKFVKADPRLHNAIRVGDWATWETVYNGGGYGGVYAAKIRRALSTLQGSNGSAVARTMKEGDKGADVLALQVALNKRINDRPPLELDGEFGPATTAAVIHFQSARGLVPDGIVGQMTSGALDLGK